MKIQFHIHYNTKPGERICVVWSDEKTGNWEEEAALELHYSENGNWKGSVVLGK
jgi:hypothetical protein